MFRGSFVALVTPMLDGGEIDYANLEKLIDFHVKQGTDGLVIAGTTGESATLDFDEHCNFLNRSREIINQRFPMIAGTGANSTKEALHLTHCAEKAKADAVLLVTPYYNKPTQEGLYQHHKLIAEEASIDQILYNVPGRTACDMQPETVKRLSLIKNIIGIKDATGDIERLTQTQSMVRDDFVFLSGDDSTTCEFILNGGHGSISVTANVAPAKMAAMCKAALLGNSDEAKAIDRKLEGLHDKLFIESSPIPVKWAVSEMGFCNNIFRLPMTPLSEQYYHDVKQAMAQAGVM